MITGFQYRAALAITNIKIKELAKIIGLHPLTLSRFKKTSNNTYIKGNSKNLLLIQSYFSKKKIAFPNQYTVKLLNNNNSSSMTRFHFVVARIAMGMTQKQLSDVLKVSAATISLIESMDNTMPLKTRTINNTEIINFFNSIGVIFSYNHSVTLTKDPKSFIDSAKLLLDTKKKRI